MACFKQTVLFLFVNITCVVFARVISHELLSRFSDIRRMPDRLLHPDEPFPQIPDKPRFTSQPHHTTIEPQTPLSERSELDLAFIMDTTGSMSRYINNVRQHIQSLVDEIVASSNTDLRIALIEYRDHRPEDTTFVTRTHHFTSSVPTMKSWLNAARANGGGDRPEAVADAMYQATTLRWRVNAAKISVLISDAPPHGLVPPEDNSFPSGSPNGHDPINIARKLAGEGITVYTVGCEPSILPYKDFFMAVAVLTGGQYIPLSEPHVLTDAIIGGAKEELSLKKFAADVQTEIKKSSSTGRPVDEQQIARSVFTRLKSEGATALRLVKNNQPLEGASAQAKAIAASESMADVRKIFTKGTGSSGRSGFRRISSGGRRESFGGRRISSGRRRIGSGAGRRIESEMVPMRERISRIMESARASPGASFDIAGLSLSSSFSGAGESFAAVEKSISLDQIKRLVKQEAAKLSA